MIKEVVDTRKEGVRKTGMVHADDIKVGATFITTTDCLMLKKTRNAVVCLELGIGGVYTHGTDDMMFEIREYVDIRIEIV